MSDLFDTPAPKAEGPRPLADRLRPQRLADVIGQDHLLGPYGPIGRMVAAGEWRDYALQFGKDAAVFCAYRRAADYPSARLEKRPALRNKQGMWVLYGEAGQILKRGHELPGVLAVLERRLLKLVES